MTEEFAPFNLSFKMKEMGFDKPCMGYYVYDPAGVYDSEFYYFKINVDDRYNPKNINSLHTEPKQTNAPKVSAPLWQQIMDFLRDEHKHNVVIYRSGDKYAFDVTYPGNVIAHGYEYSSYYDAREEAIWKAINHIINPKD